MSSPPETAEMKRSDDAASPITVSDVMIGEVEWYSMGPVDGVTFTVFAPKSEEKDLPVILFQAGYGSITEGHKHLLQYIAAQGFIIISPDSQGAQRCGLFGLFGFLNFCSCSDVTVDGSQMSKSLAFAKNKENKWMDRADTSKITAMGFSMGGQEVIHFQARHREEVKALVILSGSVQNPITSCIGANPCCYPLSGGHCNVCSDTPVGCFGEGKAIRAWNVPSLVVTSDYDLVKEGNYRLADMAGSTIVTLKDTVLDLNLPHSKKTSSWGAFLPCTCYGGPFFGLPRHFAIAHEERVVAGEPVVQFLNSVFREGPEMKGSSRMYGNALNTKAPSICCAPFPAFKSCCEV